MRPVPQEALDLIQGFESCRLAAYHDAVGLPTQGWGHLLSSVAWSPLPPGAWTQQQADEQFEKDVFLCGALWVTKYVTRPMSEGQYGALVSFVYNNKPPAFRSSTLLRRFNQGDVA